VSTKLAKTCLLLTLVRCGDGPPGDPGARTGTRAAFNNNLACARYNSAAQDYAPVQVVGARSGGKLLPPGHDQIAWQRPATVASPTYFGPFSGTPGQPASHEGVDYVNGSSGPSSVAIRAAAAGLVVYVRAGCPQSCLFCHNSLVRECGAGWGNHVVLFHGGEIYTRYAHLKPGSILVQVGRQVAKGQQIATMGNSGRSELRHLHFELGTQPSGFDACARSQSFHRVYDPQQLPFGNQVAPPPHYGLIHCPTGYALQSINPAGGKLCVTGSHTQAPGAEAFGPFTERMKQRCQAWGGGASCLLKDNWSRPLAEGAYGAGSCPDGAARDLETGYCVEGQNAFGPFPPAMVAVCQCDPASSPGCLGGGLACGKARWHVAVMRAAYRQVHGAP
jgi:murein DD-endopeptidase MepM/ murein hydrolase activator NlpD